MIKKLVAMIAGILLAAAVSYLGWLAAGDSRFVIWFGLASALVAPLAISLIGYAFRAGETEALQELSRLPEIQELVDKARSQEEKIRLLENERGRLEEIVKYETMRQTLLGRKKQLENEGRRVLKALEAVDGELNALGDEIEASPAREEIQRLTERLHAREQGEIVLTLGSSEFRVNPANLGRGPTGQLLAFYVRLLASILSRIRGRVRDT